MERVGEFMGFKKFFLILIPLLAFALPASAVVIDFSEADFASELPNGEYEHIGIFSSNASIIDTSGTNPVEGFDQYLGMNGDEGGQLGLSFDDPMIVHCDGIALQFAEFQGDVFMSINEDEMVAENMWQFNGITLGGANVFAFDNSGVGALFVSGDLDSFVIGGSDIAIDNLVVSYHVPEPASLLLISCGGFLLRRKRS
jgi:hypothetical protein